MAGPRRIVSLVPSTTETLFALTGPDRVVGVTRFCVHPAEARERATVIGGTKNPRIEAILSLEPDLVVANQEENRKEDVERLREHVPVHVFFPENVDEAIRDIRDLGALVDEAEAAGRFVSETERELALTRGRSWPGVPYLYFIWRRPYMVAGPGTFLEALLSECGFRSSAPRDRGRYPEMSEREIQSSGAEVLFLSSEPYPFAETHRKEIEERVSIPAMLVDGELLSWHGIRLRQGLPYLRALAERVSRL